MMKDQSFFNTNQMDTSLDRVDGYVKVTGSATYSAEYPIENLVHAVLVTSTIAKGQITHIDKKSAEVAKGVLAVISYLNAPAIPGYGVKSNPPERAPIGTNFRIFFDEFIYFSGQPIAMVVAETLEQAVYAASLVQVKYQVETHHTNFEENMSKAVFPQSVQRDKNSVFKDYSRGASDWTSQAEVNIAATYTIATQHHQPMESHAIIAYWEGGNKLTVYDKNQGVKSVQGNLANAFKLPRENVNVHSKFIGGAFGSGIRLWPHSIAAVLAAKVVKRPVKLVLSRELMLTSVGYRPYTVQKLAVGASAEGKLIGITHEGIGQTSTYEEHTERTILPARSLYHCPNVATKYRLLNLNVNTPTWMRGPGDATGMFALESAMDEMAFALEIDPLKFRLLNYANSDLEKNLPWSAKYLNECYKLGAEKFNWESRPLAPRSIKKDGALVGYGMATSLYGYHRRNSQARAVMFDNGKVVVQSATMDIGPGTGTAMTQIASKILGVDPALIQFDLGDSKLPDAPGQSGSSTIPSVGSVVHEACEALKDKLINLASEMPNSVFQSIEKDKIYTRNGSIFPTEQSSVGVEYAAILKHHHLKELEVLEESKSGSEIDQYSMYSFGCHFVEVHVDEVTCEVRVKRVVTCADVGKIINYKSARSQSIGGIVGGIGMALMEKSVIDHRYGRYVTHDFSNYHIPVNADIPQIDVLFVDKPDVHANPIGSKGLGEIAIVGVAAAVANAVFHATGVRVRELPITMDKLLV